jgi:6-phosphogluconolactonase
MQINKYNSSHTLINSVILEISTKANSAIKNNDEFHIVLTGGETPIFIYEKLKHIQTEWTKWHFYYTDERMNCESIHFKNEYIIRNNLLKHIPIKESQIHFMEELNDINNTIELYSSFFDLAPNFDLTLIGIGEDGHVASLFPGQFLGLSIDSPSLIPVYNSPKYPTQRISFSMSRINRSLSIFIIAMGETKRKIINKLIDGHDMPALHIKAIYDTTLFYFTD